MFCQQCGAKNIDQAKFCTQCGTSISHAENVNLATGPRIGASREQRAAGKADDIVLWNPFAAMLWSILFTPIFGATLHKLNWEQMGEKTEAEIDGIWIIAGIVLYILSLYLGAINENNIGYGLQFAYLIAWIIFGSMRQIDKIKHKYGESYKHKDWTAPILIAVGLFFIYGFTWGAISLGAMFPFHF